MSLAWVRSACSSYLRSASVRLSLGSESFFSPSSSPAASSRGLSASLCACGSWRARGEISGGMGEGCQGSGGRAHLLVLFLLLLDAASRGLAPASLELQAALHDVLITLARRHGDRQPLSDWRSIRAVTGEISVTEHSLVVKQETREATDDAHIERRRPAAARTVARHACSGVV